jgi:hypothetical protein
VLLINLGDGFMFLERGFMKERFWTEEIVYQMLDRKSKLEWLIAEKTKALQGAPEGGLKSARKGESFQYYFRLKKDDKWVYIPAINVAKAAALAQRDYDLQVLKRAKDELMIVNSYLAYVSVTGMSDLFEKSSAGRRALIKPLTVKDADFVKEWLSVEYEPLEGFETSGVYVSGNGVYVRSKSELMIANMLEKRGVPYRYEYPVKLKDKRGRVGYEGNTVRPDFVCLNVRTRKEIIWEHMGMMDNIPYANKNVNKLNQYQRSGYSLGKDLICTFETSQVPLGSDVISKMIDEFLV